MRQLVAILVVLLFVSCQPATNLVHLEGTIHLSLVEPSCLYLDVDDVYWWLATLPAGYTWQAERQELVGPDGRAVASAGDRMFVDGKAFGTTGDAICVTTHSVNVERFGPLPSAASSGDQPATTSSTASEPTTLVAFSHGSARIQATRGMVVDVVLDDLASASFQGGYDPTPPQIAQAEWAHAGREWLLIVVVSGVAGRGSGQQATLSIKRLDSEPPLRADSSACLTEITEMSPRGLVGRADCRDLRWISDYDLDPDKASPIPNLPPFDLLITFEARP